MSDEQRFSKAGSALYNETLVFGQGRKEIIAPINGAPVFNAGRNVVFTEINRLKPIDQRFELGITLQRFCQVPRKASSEPNLIFRNLIFGIAANRGKERFHKIGRDVPRNFIDVDFRFRDWTPPALLTPVLAESQPVVRQRTSSIGDLFQGGRQ